METTSRFAAPVRVQIRWDHRGDGAAVGTFTTDVRWREQWDNQAAEQELVNDLFARYGAGVALRACRAIAARDHHQYRQYRQYWLDESWQLARCTTTLAGKGGTQAAAGDLVMARPIAPQAWRQFDHGTFYSVRRGVNCSISGGIEWL